MYNLNELAPKICYFTNCLTDPKKLVDEIEKSNFDENIKRNILSEWRNWSASNVPEDQYGTGMFTKFSNINDPEIDDRSKYILTEITNAFMECSKKYKEHYNLDHEVNLDDEFGIKKYFVGKGLGPHADQYDGNMRLRYSLVLYVNDDYEGGELLFENHDVGVKPEAGSLAIFPSSYPYLHESTPLISGAKIMCPAFWMTEG